jgi:hypothetical protein
MNIGVDESEVTDSAGESRRMGEYADQLRSWLGQAYQWQTLQCLPYSFPSVFIQNRHRPLPTNLSNPVSFTTETPVTPLTNVNHQQRQSPTGIGSAPAESPLEGI